jgi:hypothetical protein
VRRNTHAILTRPTPNPDGWLSVSFRKVAAAGFSDAGDCVYYGLCVPDMAPTHVNPEHDRTFNPNPQGSSAKCVSIASKGQLLPKGGVARTNDWTLSVKDGDVLTLQYHPKLGVLYAKCSRHGKSVRCFEDLPANLTFFVSLRHESAGSVQIIDLDVDSEAWEGLPEDVTNDPFPPACEEVVVAVPAVPAVPALDVRADADALVRTTATHTYTHSQAHTHTHTHTHTHSQVHAHTHIFYTY